MSGNTIFGLVPFTPKRIVILPALGGEVTLYVLDGKAYPTIIMEPGETRVGVITSVHFAGWTPVFANKSLRVPMKALARETRSEFMHCFVEVTFRLVPSERYGQTAEIVAIRYGDNLFYYENEICTIVDEVERRATS